MACGASSTGTSTSGTGDALAGGGIITGFSDRALIAGMVNTGILSVANDCASGRRRTYNKVCFSARLRGLIYLERVVVRGVGLGSGTRVKVSRCFTGGSFIACAALTSGGDCFLGLGAKGCGRLPVSLCNGAVRTFTDKSCECVLISGPGDSNASGICLVSAGGLDCRVVSDSCGTCVCLVLSSGKDCTTFAMEGSSNSVPDSCASDG